MFKNFVQLLGSANLCTQEPQEPKLDKQKEILSFVSVEQQMIKDKEETLKLSREGREVYLQWCYTQKSLKHKWKEKNLEFYTKGKGEI